MVAAGAAHGAESGAIENNNTNNDSLYSEKQPYYQSRIQLFEKYFTREQEKIAQAKTDDREISVALPDGKEIKAVANATTPWDIAMGISKKLAQASLVAHVDGNDWDMKRPLNRIVNCVCFRSTIRKGRSCIGTRARTCWEKRWSWNTARI